MTIIRSVALLSTSPHVTQAMLAAWAPVYQAQAALKVADWLAVYPELVAPTYRAVAAVSDLRDGDCPFLFTPTIDQPGDAAYHYERNGLPYGVILADEYTPISQMQQAGDHEGEAIVDPDCNLYGPDGNAIEIHDLLQATPVVVEGILCSPWGLPSWWRLGVLGGPTNSAGIALAAGEVGPGGYTMRRDGTELSAPGYQHSPTKLGYHSRRGKRRRALGLA